MPEDGEGMPEHKEQKRKKEKQVKDKDKDKEGKPAKGVEDKGDKKKAKKEKKEKKEKEKKTAEGEEADDKKARGKSKGKSRSRSRSRSRKKARSESSSGKKSEAGSQRALQRTRTGSDSSFIEYDPRGGGDVATSSADQEQEVPEERSPSVVTVHRMDNLVPDPLVVHPVVRFWVVDGVTGADISGYQYPYQLIPEPAPDGTPQPPIAGNGGFYTYPCNLREIKDFIPKWEDSISLGLDLQCLIKAYPEALLLLEVVDCSRLNVQKHPKTRRNYGPSYERQFTPMCWGYLRLRGIIGPSSNLMGSFRIQLFRCPQTRSFVKRAFLRAWPSAMYPNSAVPVAGVGNADYRDVRIPPLYHTFRETINRLDKYPASLYITLDTEDDRDMVPRHVSDALKTLLADCRKALNPVPLNDAQSGAFAPADAHDDIVGEDEKIELLDCSRRRTEKCLQPDFLQASLPAGKKGCLALAFSPCGNYLALAACDEGSVEIRVHDTKFGPNTKEEGNPSERLACPLVAAFDGHSDTVYCLLWTAGSKEIITCSADCTAKQWPFARCCDFSWVKYPTKESLAKAVASGSLTSRSTAEFTYVHPCYVYTAVHHPLGAMLVTGGFDETLRCWSTVSGSIIKSFKAAPKSWVSHLALTTDGSMLFSADGHGELKLWTVSGFSRAEKVPNINTWATIEEFKGKGISCLAVDTPKKHLYVWTRVDSCITCINTSTYSRFSQVRQYRGPRFESCAIKGSLSPCGSMVCTGSPMGTIFIWDTQANESQENVRYDYQQTGPVYHTVWSPTDHRMAFSSYSARLNLVTVWYRPRQEEDISLVKSYDAFWPGNRGVAVGHRPSLPQADQGNILDIPVDTSLDWMSQIIQQWSNRVSKRCQRLIQIGTAIEVREGSFWRPANVSGWTSEGQCCVEFTDGKGGTANVPPVLIRRLKTAGCMTATSSDLLSSQGRQFSGLTKTTEDILRKTEMLVGRYSSVEDTIGNGKDVEEMSFRARRPSRAWGGMTPTLKVKKEKKSHSKSGKKSDKA